MSKNTLLSELINYISANSSGNVVIAAPSSGYALDVTGTGRFTSSITGVNATFAGTPSNTVQAAGSPYLYLNGGTGTSYTTLQQGVGKFDIHQFNGSTFVNTFTITSAGNVGIGITPQGIGTAKTLEIGSRGLIYDNNDNFAYVNNGYNDGSWRYKQTGFATILSTDSGSFVFSNAPSGSQGSAFSFTERVRISANGEIGVAMTGLTTTTTGTLITRGQAYANLRLFGTEGQTWASFYLSGTAVGSITGSGSTTSYNTSSDYRLKEDLKPVKGLEIVNKINVYDYKWKSNNSRMDGVLAHELAEVLPYAVHGIKDGEEMQGVDYSKIVPVMVQAIKELKSEIDLLKQQ